MDLKKTTVVQTLKMIFRENLFYEGNKALHANQFGVIVFLSYFCIQIKNSCCTNRKEEGSTMALYLKTFKSQALFFLLRIVNVNL